MSRPDEFSAPVLNGIQQLGRATRDQLIDVIQGIKKKQVDNAIKTLIRRGVIQNVSPNPRPAIYTADMAVKAPPKVKRVYKPKIEEPEKYVGVITPGVMINKMAGVYVPTRTQPMRPGATDHEACMSRRADGFVPYSGQYIATGVTEK